MSDAARSLASGSPGKASPVTVPPASDLAPIGELLAHRKALAGDLAAAEAKLPGLTRAVTQARRDVAMASVSGDAGELAAARSLRDADELALEDATDRRDGLRLALDEHDTTIRTADPRSPGIQAIGKLADRVNGLAEGIAQEWTAMLPAIVELLARAVALEQATEGVTYGRTRITSPLVSLAAVRLPRDLVVSQFDPLSVIDARDMRVRHTDPLPQPPAELTEAVQALDELRRLEANLYRQRQLAEANATAAG